MKSILEKASEHDPVVARIVLMEVVLKLLGYHYQGNGIESGCYKIKSDGTHLDYWFHDDGRVSLRKNSRLIWIL